MLVGKEVVLKTFRLGVQPPFSQPSTQMKLSNSLCSAADQRHTASPAALHPDPVWPAMWSLGLIPQPLLASNLKPM